MNKFKILAIICIGAFSFSCTHHNISSPTERIISSTNKGNETGNPFNVSVCLGNLDIDMDPVAIQNKFHVELIRDSNFPSINEARNLCLSKIKSFGYQCNFRNWSSKDDNSGRLIYHSEAEPIIDADFLKKYRQHLICNRIFSCEQQASVDENVSTSMIDKLHRIYENNNCDLPSDEKTSKEKNIPKPVIVIPVSI